MGKKKKLNQKGVKGLHLPTMVAYAVAGMGVVFIIIFLIFIFSKGSGKEKVTLQEKERFENLLKQYQDVLIEKKGDSKNDEEGIIIVDKEKWQKLPFDSKEALCFAASKDLEIMTLLIKDKEQKHLGTYRSGGRLFENK